MLQCASCGVDNAAVNRFCGQCGAALMSICSECGAESPPSQRFCGQCGATLSGGRPPTPASAAPESVDGSGDGASPVGLGGELRWVSVVFVDLVNYTSWSESQDAEDVRELLSGYFEVASTVVGRYGGVVEKFIGDAVMAVWGAPVAAEDDAERAVRAGLEMVAAVTEFGRRRGLAELRARAGVVTGQVATWDSPGEGLVTGDRVNTAARVQAAAEPGWVLVDGETRAASAAAVAYASAGEHQLKGKVDPVALWRAVRVVGGVGGEQRVDGLEAGFIGRARELALVKELFHASQESGRARLALVVGAAGVGKSRLGWEFEKYIDGLAATVWWHRGRCLSYGDGVAFWALAEMVRQRFGIEATDPPGVAAAKLAEGLPRWVSDPAERDFVAPRLAVLVGAHGGVEVSREELFAGWRLFVERLAAAGPVVLVVEDLQWADAGLLDFVEHLLDWSAGCPVFVLALARPELLERRPGWLADRRNVSQVHLTPLPVAAVDELLEALVPGMPAAAKTRIGERAGGVPLFAVETIRSLVDRDVVVPEGGVYRLVGDVGDLQVPGTLTSLLGARLDGLPVEERALVKGLAVLGTSFPRAAVDAITDSPADRVDGWLQALVRKEILTMHTDPLSPDRGQYVFTQGMLRGVAYDTLTKRERKSRHLAVAAHLRQEFPDDGEEVVEVVAAHYHDAYLAAPGDADAEAVRVEAVDSFERAGRRAGAVGAPDAAERAYRIAATLASTEPETTRFIEEAAGMAARAGRYEDALTLFQSAAAAHTAAGRVGEAARLASPISPCLRRLGRGLETLQPLKDAIGVFDDSPTDPALADLHGQLALVLAVAGGDDAEGEHHLERALILASDLELPEVLTKALDTKSFFLLKQARTVEAIAMLSAAVEMSSKHGLVERQLLARNNLGDARWQSDLPAAAEEFEAAAALAVRLGDRGGRAMALYNLALIRFFGGHWDAANRALQQSLEGHPGELEAAYNRSALVLLQVAQGLFAEAEQQVRELTVLDASDNPQDRAGVGLARGAVALLAGRLEEGFEKAASTARAAVEQLGIQSDGFRLAWPMSLRAALATGRVDEARSLLALVAGAPVGRVPPYLRAELAHYRALIDAATGNHDTVEADLRQAIATLGDLAYPYWLARTQVDLARWLIDQERTGDAEPLLTEAVETFTRLGARPALDTAALLLAELRGAPPEPASVSPPTASAERSIH